MRKPTIYLILIAIIGIVMGSCASQGSKKGCDGRHKTRVEMGWM